MSKLFGVGDKVFIKGYPNEVYKITTISYIYKSVILSNGYCDYWDAIELWNPKTDLEGGIK